MTQGIRRVDFGDNSKDRISFMPRDIVDRILGFLPMEDAARTCILSKHWRYIWHGIPNLVLDNHFCSILTSKSHSSFKEIVDKILLQHIGDIVRFDLDVLGIDQLSLDTRIDNWLLYVIRKGVKQLTLRMQCHTTYKLPSYLFSCHALTHLKLFYCDFKPPGDSLCFPNLLTLHLEKITFLPTSDDLAINVPFLSKLTLLFCVGTQHLNFVAPQLYHLQVRLRHFPEPGCFMNCKNLRRLRLSGLFVSDLEYIKKPAMERLLLNLPMLTSLRLDSVFVELLSAGTVSKDPFKLKRLQHLTLVVNFSKLDQTCYALQLINCSNNLSQLVLHVGLDTLGSGEDVLKYLDTLACLDQPLNNLKKVFIHNFNGSKAELVFVKLLLAHSPSLVSMSIKHKRDLGSTELYNITTELMRFPRASSKAELLFSKWSLFEYFLADMKKSRNE